MTAGRRHSTVFDALRLIRDGITEASWPTHGDTLDPPDVGFAFDESPDAEIAVERVQVLDRIEDDAAIEWSRVSPGGRDERFLVDIVIVTAVPGQSRDECWDRLAELADVVQGVFYNPTTLQFTPPGDADFWMALGGVARVTPRMWHDAEGWVGQCVVTVAVATRI